MKMELKIILSMVRISRIRKVVLSIYFEISAWTTDRSKRAILASSVSSRMELRLPAGSGNDSLVNIIIEIRDTLNCITEFDLSSISVRIDTAITNELINILQQTNTQSINSNPVIQLLSSGNQNTIGQVLTSLSQIFNEINQQNLETTVQSQILLLSVSPQFSLLFEI